MNLRRVLVIYIILKQNPNETYFGIFYAMYTCAVQCSILQIIDDEFVFQPSAIHKMYDSCTSHHLSLFLFCFPFQLVYILCGAGK